MKNIHDVIRQKELNIERLKKEIEALHIVVPMLQDKETPPAKTPPAKTNSAPQNSEAGSASANSGTTTEIIWQ
jgi:hypothetical protein